MVLVLCTLPDNALNFVKVSQRFLITDSNSRVNTRVFKIYKGA